MSYSIQVKLFPHLQPYVSLSFNIHTHTHITTKAIFMQLPSSEIRNRAWKDPRMLTQASPHHKAETGVLSPTFFGKPAPRHSRVT